MIDAIAIDGPAASGKTAIGSAVARELGFRFLDTGAMYRAITWAALERGIDLHDEATLALLANNVVVEVREAPEGSLEATGVTLDGADATSHLRDADVDANVSFVSRVSEVRKALVRIQREIAHGGSIVMVGRDIGSVVLPEARVKVYLDASPDVRARRRADQIRSAGVETDFDPLVADLKRRDAIDAGRATSPLTAAPGAVIINTDDLSLEEVVRRVAALAAQA